MCAATTASFGQMDYKSPRKLKMVSQTMSDQLEQESRRMDERLQILRKMMSAEKARREVNGDLHWHSGQKCPPPPQHSQPRKIRQTNKKPLRVRILTEKNSGVSGLSQAPHCGQCEKSTASLCCVECVENYCMVCFAKIHQKGALSRHHVKPMTQKVSKPGMKPAHEDSSTNTAQAGAGTKFTTATEVQACVEKAPQHSVVSSQFSLRDNQSSSQLPTGSLLEGTYDEAASAASFQQALAQWRGEGVKDKTENTVTCKDSSSNTKTSTNTQSVLVGSTQTDQPTTISIPHSDLKVQFSDKEAGVSYFERLMMRRHRVDPVFLAKMNKTKSARIQNCQEEFRESGVQETDILDDHQSQVESCPSQYNIFYAAEVDGDTEMPSEDAGMSGSYQQSDCEVLEAFERPLSSVRIEEMHDDCVAPSANTYTCTAYNIENATLDSKGSVPPQDKSRRDRSSNKPKVNKPNSAKGSKLKTSREPLRTRSKEPQRGKTKAATPSHGDTRSLKVIQPAVAASVKSAWGRSTQADNASDQLTGFFLSGVQQSTPEAHHQLPVQDRLVEPSATDNNQFEFASTIWLPANSIPDPSINPESATSRDATSFDGSGACSQRDTCAIDIATDLPPPSAPSHPPQLVTSSDTLTPTPSYYDSITSSDCESADQDEPSVVDVECEMEGRQWLELQQQEDEEDEEALETLAWELASVTGGRLTRCDREEEEEEEENGVMESFGREGGELVEGSYFGSGADLQQVMSDFELYQRQIMEEESD